MDKRFEDLEYEDLIQLLQDGEINELQFVELQPDMIDDFKTYIKENQLPYDNQSAISFIKHVDEEEMYYIFFNNNNL